uniref:GPI transamidase component PIG-T n=1 Tax=Cannabis sativa TaxID=3483 RepID=A0A803PG29_CANSA
MYADREDAENRRSIKDRLNGSFRDFGQRQDDKWEHDLYEDNEAQVSNRQIDSRDLRLKLQRKNQQASVSGRGSHSGVRDLREKLSGSMHPQPVNYDPHKPSLEAAKPTRRSVANSAAKKKAPQKASTSVDDFLFLYLILFCQCLCANATLRSAIGEEEFSEELLLRPLPDRKILAHFHFGTSAPPISSNGHHHHLFPKAISQLVKKFQLKEMELSFTQGRWNYESWGGFDPIPSNNAKPPGVELWAVFDVPQHQVDASWKNLTHALSGLFCASINFLESSTSYSAPQWGFRSASGSLRYGTLPREAVCTENLTPWLKLLPCRDKAGLAALMDRPSIYKGFYHSQRLHLTSNEFDSNGVDSGILLEQTLTVVLQPHERRTLITSQETKPQPIAELDKLPKENEISVADDIVYEGLRSSPGFQLSVKPDRVLEEVVGSYKSNPSLLYVYSVEKYSESEPFDLGLTWKLPVVWSCQQAPLHASRFLMGSGNERGAIAISFKPTGLNGNLLHFDTTKESCKLQVKIFQVVPWYIKVYYHTLQVFVDEQPQTVSDSVEKMHVSPSEDKVSPGSMEMLLKLPCAMKSAVVTLEFDKGFLHIDEYPPDANQGFDIPSALVSYPDFQASIHYIEDKSLETLPILAKLQENSTVLSYTEVLLVPLTTPDFSMPYNVITITCTVFALYFGSLLNVLRRRVAEEERFLKNKDSKKASPISRFLSKLSSKITGRPLKTAESPSTKSSFFSSKLILKIILVAGIAVVWKFYLE